MGYINFWVLHSSGPELHQLFVHVHLLKAFTERSVLIVASYIFATS
jgi:hypothetical protein